MKRTAEIIPFGRRPTPPPIAKAPRGWLIDAILDLAVDIEAGKISEFSAVYVRANGKTGEIFLRPRDPKKLLVALERSKSGIIAMLEEDGLRE